MLDFTWSRLYSSLIVAKGIAAYQIFYASDKSMNSDRGKSFDFLSVIVKKSCGEMSLMEQDTIENVSKPIKNLEYFLTISYIFDKYIKMCHKLYHFI